MSTFTFFSALEKLTSSDNDINKENKRIVIPDYFIKLLLQNKTRLLKEQFSKKSVKELFINRHIGSNYHIEHKLPNFLGNQKYKSLEKNSNYLENNKYNTPLPRISERKTLINLRYKEDPRNYDKYQNLGKEYINISKYNNNQGDSLNTNRNSNKYYFISKNKKLNSNENLKINNNDIESNDTNKVNLHCQNMTFVGPFSSSMLMKNIDKINNVDDIMVNEIITSNYFQNKNIQQINDNNSINNNYNNIIININERNIQNINNKNISSPLYNSTDNRNIYEYNYNYNKNVGINKKEKEIEKEKAKNRNKKIIYNSSVNSTEAPKKNIFSKKNFRDNQINIRSVKYLNSFSSNTKKNNKAQIQSKIIPIILLSDFKHKYISQEEFEQNLSKKIIYFPLNINISQNNSKDIYYYFINKMYRSQLIEYMKHRTNWELITNNDGQKTLNFVWKYMSNRINFKNFKFDQNKPCKKLRMVNLFEKNYEVGNKKNMFINLINYCDKININAFDLVPFTIIINNTKDVDFCLEAIFEIMHFVNKNKNFNKDLITNRMYNEHFWFDKNFENLNRQYININKNFLSYKNYWILKPTDLYQGKCIEICNSYQEINKKCRNIFKGVEKKFIPELIIKEEESDDENIQNINNSKIISNINIETSPNNINNNIENKNNAINNTIIKDINSNTNNNNTNITNNNNTNNTNNANNNNTNTNNNISNKKKIAYSKMYCSNEIIIQKYLDRPLLYNKRKFDIRCFVLVDSNLNIFFCREGHLKGSSEYYDLNNTNKLIHITNYSLQKKSSNFEQFEDGNEISYNDFKKYMKENNIPFENFNYMINQMKYLVEISFKSVGKKLLKTNPVLCFEIFGYDFIIDNDFKPWILEINNNPGLCISSPLIKKLIPRMLDDAFRLTIDKVFETRYSPEVIDGNKYKSKFKLDGYSDEENVFEFLCNIN